MEKMIVSENKEKLSEATKSNKSGELSMSLKRNGKVVKEKRIYRADGVGKVTEQTVND